jgi:hypothetical protein
VYFNDEVVMSCARDRKFRVWRRAEFFSNHRAKESFTQSANGGFTALRCDDKLAVVACLNGTVLVYRKGDEGWAVPEEVSTLAAHSAGVFSLAMDDKWLLTGAKDNNGALCFVVCSALMCLPLVCSVKVWDRDLLTLLGTLSGHDQMVRAVINTGPYV